MLYSAAALGFAFCQLTSAFGSKLSANFITHDVFMVCPIEGSSELVPTTLTTRAHQMRWQQAHLEYTCVVYELVYRQLSSRFDADAFHERRVDCADVRKRVDLKDRLTNTWHTPAKRTDSVSVRSEASLTHLFDHRQRQATRAVVIVLYKLAVCMVQVRERTTTFMSDVAHLSTSV